jgi:hypothetical protein
VRLEKALMMRERSLANLFIEVSTSTLIGPTPLRYGWLAGFQHSYRVVGGSASMAVLGRRPRGPSGDLLSKRRRIDADCLIVSDWRDGRVDPARRKFPTLGEPGVAIVVGDALYAFAKLNEDRALAGSN